MADTSESSHSITVDELDAIRQGDIEAFKKLYNGRFEEMCHYAATIVSEDEASDIVQDVFLTLWNKRKEIVLESDDDIKFYLLKSVRNRAVSVIRKYSTRDKYQPALEIEASINEYDINYSDTHLDPEKLDVSNSESVNSKSDLVRGFIESLPARSREILMLRWYHGLDFEKISIVMGISYSYAHLLHSRAMAKVKARLGVLPRSP